MDDSDENAKSASETIELMKQEAGKSALARKKIVDVAAIVDGVARAHPRFRVAGAVASVSPTAVEISDRAGALTVGARVAIDTGGEALLAEVCKIESATAIALPFGPVAGVRRGALARRIGVDQAIYPNAAWRGRILDALARPIDGRGPLPPGAVARPLRASPPPAPMRARLGGPVDFGVKAMTAFTPARKGQRLGLFAGAGLGKSTLLSMIARNTDCDVAVIALIGERGREVRDFVEDALGAAGLARAVVVVATSDEPAIVRREAAFTAMAVAEHFRDEGAHVLCLMDSITRIATAQREIGLAAGEPPTSRGYTPSVFSLLPGLLERAGARRRRVRRSHKRRLQRACRGRRSRRTDRRCGAGDP